RRASQVRLRRRPRRGHPHHQRLRLRRRRPFPGDPPEKQNAGRGSTRIKSGLTRIRREWVLATARASLESLLFRSIRVDRLFYPCESESKKTSRRQGEEVFGVGVGSGGFGLGGVVAGGGERVEDGGDARRFVALAAMARVGLVGCVGFQQQVNEKHGRAELAQAARAFVGPRTA